MRRESSPGFLPPGGSPRGSTPALEGPGGPWEPSSAPYPVVHWGPAEPAQGPRLALPALLGTFPVGCQPPAGGPCSCYPQARVGGLTWVWLVTSYLLPGVGSAAGQARVSLPSCVRVCQDTSRLPRVHPRCGGTSRVTCPPGRVGEGTTCTEALFQPALSLQLPASTAKGSLTPAATHSLAESRCSINICQTAL